MRFSGLPRTRGAGGRVMERDGPVRLLLPFGQFTFKGLKAAPSHFPRQVFVYLSGLLLFCDSPPTRRDH